MVYLGVTPSYESLASEFAWEVTAPRERDRRAAAEPVLYRLDRLTRWRLHLLPRIDMPYLVARHAHHGPVLDIGCGDGGALARLRPGFTPHGIEISPVLADRADQEFRARGGRAVCAPAVRGLHAFPEGYFSAVVLRSYLEHEFAPREVLEGVHRILCDGGIVLIKVPNFDSLNRRVRGARWCGFRHPDHVNYFTPRTLALMVRDCGFMSRIGFTDAFPTSDNLWARLTKDPKARGRGALHHIRSYHAPGHAIAPQAMAETSG
jgi:SAM-dependent methyltransferase